ncbi:MAG TPA: hypothetical protein VGF17_20145 [Phytomonospora sp.]
MTRPANNLVYLDTEFTNLDPRLGDVIEVGWLVGDDPEVNTILLPHSLVHATPEALVVNRYYERGLDQYATTVPANTAALTSGLVAALTGSTIVAENYGIDCAKLLTLLGFEPWHYRKIEVSSVAMTVFDLDRPEGLAATAARLRNLGFEVGEGDHSAGGDAYCLRECYRALRRIRRDGDLRLGEHAA